MEVIKFTLKGEGAAFCKPHTNATNLTYTHIHKLILLGIFGCIMGLGGHSQKCKEAKYPEYYEKLKNLKISILPKHPHITKNLKEITETSGLYNKGQNQIIKEQFLVNPEWDIYVSKGDAEDKNYDILKYMLLNGECIFIPYLGRNHYMADFKDVVVVELEDVEILDVNKVDSLIKRDIVEYIDNFSLEDDFYNIEEYYPTKYRPFINHYIEEKFILTNKEIKVMDKCMILRDKEKCLYFL